MWLLERSEECLSLQKASQAFPQSTMNHRDIARHQASSSVFSWQQEKTPSRLSSSALQTPSRREFSASHFSGDQDVTPSRSTLQVGKRDANGSFCDNSSSSNLLDQLKAQNQGNFLSSSLHFPERISEVIADIFNPRKCLCVLLNTSVVNVPFWWCELLSFWWWEKIPQFWSAPLFVLKSWCPEAFQSRMSGFDLSFQKQGE